ncbi:MAG: hypothetical protein AB1531_04360, partial [Chloroflexota bacterium]
MKKRSNFWVFLLSGLLILVLLAAGGWWFFKPQYPASDASPESPVFVFLLSPSNGDEVNAGDFVSV